LALFFGKRSIIQVSEGQLRNAMGQDIQGELVGLAVEVVMNNAG
jgi:hypothetical protein